MNGLSILPRHAVIVNKNNSKITVMPMEGAEILVNGRRINGETELQQNDRYFNYRKLIECTTYKSRSSHYRDFRYFKSKVVKKISYRFTKSLF